MVYFTRTSNTSSSLGKWHERLGHYNSRSIQRLAKREIVQGLEECKDDKQASEDNCESCLGSKSHLNPLKGSPERTKTPAESIHVDMERPTEVAGMKGERYRLTMVDEAT